MSESRGRPRELGEHDFIGTRVPKSDARRLDEIVESGPWKNKSEFVREAICEKLEVEEDV